MSNKSYIKTFASVESAKKNLLSRQRISLVNYKLPKEQQKMNKEIFKKNLSPFQLVSKIIGDVIKDGDNAVKKYCSILDGAELDSLLVSENEIETAFKDVPKSEIDAIQYMSERIRNYHEILSLIHI